MEEPATPDPAGPRAQRARTIDSIMPIVAFVLLNRLAGLGWAVLGATTWSVKAAVSRHRRGEGVGWYLPTLVVYLVVRGVVGILTDSEAVYFGIGIGTKALIGAALVGTAVVGRPFLGRVLHLAIPLDAETMAHPVYLRVVSRLTVALGLYQFLTSAWDIWLFNQTSADGYVVIRAVVGWPVGMAVSLLGFWYFDRALRAVDGFPGLLALLDPDLAAEEGSS
ncbi:MAG: DUF3159 domain-containing protein [Acidimicrobiales bacterium]|nr:DUF3159 domain-containing protein [Acidimicrobiales bacterium]MDP6281511.1 DUF3159 domain-containing protein [Acidimicrobiales bacterium]MDP7117344.1 DUF3159 domain-containing protein [Acidimicrobiales bacterium]MDP7411290.1 DUF3159 domain-containing protein [Acidimicrobiales bacterium]MEE1521811.1 DUF3159 domain-containing protein [Acidimicrobiales bacterium]|tara:strand:+ start:922 stop:1587 length:666 start_codon:yes stop_codon:yes gene_type:complete